MTVIHDDAHCSLFDKPAGLLAVPGRGEDKQDCLCHRVPPALAGCAGGAPAGHGDLGADAVCARRRRCSVALSRAFASRQVDKQYVAIVAGRHAGNGTGASTCR